MNMFWSYFSILVKIVPNTREYCVPVLLVNQTQVRKIQFRMWRSAEMIKFTFCKLKTFFLKEYLVKYVKMKKKRFIELQAIKGIW